MNFDVNFQENENKFSAEFKNLNIVEKLATKVLIDGEVQETFVPDEYVGDAVVEMLDEGLAGKLDKVNTKYRIYATDGKGEQITYAFSAVLTPSSFPYRKTDGEIETGRATADEDAVPLAQMNEALSGKLDISNSANKLYGVGNGGEQRLYSISGNADGNTVAYRGAYGRMNVGEATASTHAVPLGQFNTILDERIGDISTALDEIIKIQNALIPSKNLFNLAAIANEPSLTVDVEAGTVYVSGMTQTSIPFSAVCPKAEVGKTYTLSYKKTSPNGGIGVNGSGWDSYEFSGTFVLTDTIYNGVVYFTAFADDSYLDLTDSTISEIMLNEGNTALPYEPYRG